MLLSITNEIYQSFQDGIEVRGVFLDISKAFDKAWHHGLIFKHRQYVVTDKVRSIKKQLHRGVP